MPLPEPWDEDWLRATPRATYEECVAAGVCAGRSYASFHSKKGRMKREGALRTQTVVALPDGARQTVNDDAPDELYEKLFALLEETDEVIAELSPTQESTEWYAPDDDLPIAIAFTGDWHLGAAGVDTQQLIRDLEVIRDTAGLYAVGMGDFCEGVNIHTKAVPALYSGLLNDGGLQDRYSLQRMSISRGKWAALVKGNHDDWMKRASGVDRLDRTIEQLGQRGQRPPLFCQGGGTIFAHVGEQRYVVAVTHNAKGNSRLNTTNAQRRAFDEWPQWEGCDVICCGHLHFNDQHTQTRKGGRCVYLRSGTYKLRDGYAANNGFKPEWGVPVVILYPDEHVAVGFRGDDFARAVRFLEMERERYRVTHLTSVA